MDLLRQSELIVFPTICQRETKNLCNTAFSPNAHTLTATSVEYQQKAKRFDALLRAPMMTHRRFELRTFSVLTGFECLC
jgi:hypothetical protein